MGQHNFRAHYYIIVVFILNEEEKNEIRKKTTGHWIILLIHDIYLNSSMNLDDTNIQRNRIQINNFGNATLGIETHWNNEGTYTQKLSGKYNHINRQSTQHIEKKEPNEN